MGSSFSMEVDRADDAEWSSLLEGFTDASLYQTAAYGLVSWGARQVSRLVLRRDGDPVALAQVRVVELPIIGGGIAYLRWGPLCFRRGGEWDEGAFRAATEALIGEYVHRRGLILRMIPGSLEGDAAAPRVRRVWEELGLRREAEVRVYRTLRVDLGEAPEVLRKRMDQKWRNQLNAAERNGLVVEAGTSEGLYGQFASLYGEMMARKRFESSVDIEEFGRIQRLLPTSQKMAVLIAYREGRLMSALVGSVVGGTGIYLLGATGDEGMKSKGAYLLQWRMMLLLKELGCRLYDLGGINPEDNPGVYHFKRGMGGVEASELGRYRMSGSRWSVLSVGVAEWWRLRVGGRRRRDLAGRRGA